MCGILCFIRSKNGIDNMNDTEYDTVQWRLLKDQIANRGPDSLINLSKKLNDRWYCELIASVLWMQGSTVTLQPCIDDEGNILLWNGDIFGGSLADDHNSDTLTLLSKLKLNNNIVETINSIKGPFSIIYYQKATNLLYFARDKIGRHSLLIKVNQDDRSLLLCSVANKDIVNIVELPAIGIFVADLTHCNIALSYYPWGKLDEKIMRTIENFEKQLQLNIEIKNSISALIQNEIILEPNSEELLFLENLSASKNFDQIMSNLLNNIQVLERVTNILKLLKKSIKIRIQTTPRYCKNCIRDVIMKGIEMNCNHPKIGILFSGGLDSSILAVIADEFVPANESIDLINVAFEKSKVDNAKINNLSSVPPKYDVPDRKTGQQALNELRNICPNRKWNFIEVNVSCSELQLYRNTYICNLIYPSQTILDESLGCAVWFGSRGTGILSSSGESYESPCRVLLLGMGADELFGGYIRHRTTLRRHGWGALTKELEMELSRISERNLGRDDRVVCDHGRQSRLPYLDDDFVQYVQSLKPWERCYPTEHLVAGIGDKLLLRLVAYKIGLHETANFPKRAFQFGSRIANSKQNANDLSCWLR